MLFSKKKIQITTLFLISLFFGNLDIKSQNIKILGNIYGSNNKSLEYANIIAEPRDSSKLKYSFTNNKGFYELLLKSNTNYDLRISYIGYKTKRLSFKTKKDTILDFILVELSEKLDEIKIDASAAIIFKKDTITYKVEKFITGKERKLKEVLKKLPGMEVDKSGNVNINGKRVTKLLVENKKFFTGDSKLAVNNIPANVVDKVEVLESYSENNILKGLEDTDELAMNIKLKENKKKFWFGDIETGLGIKDRQVIHPSLFYYSPSKSVNFIGDLNNIGEKSFTFRDYLDFEGGYKKILLDPKAYFSRLNDDFSKFLTSNNFRESDHIFGGFNINTTLKRNTELIGYTIYSKSINDVLLESNNTYISRGNLIDEFRTQNQNPNNEFVINKLSFEKKLDDKEFIATTYFKHSDSKTRNSLVNNFGSTSNEFVTNLDRNSLNFKQDFEFYKALNEKHTFTLLSNLEISKDNGILNLTSNQNIFNGLLPILDQNFYSISKVTNTNNLNISSLFKHYWILGNFVHLYTTTGIDFYINNYKTSEFQSLSDGSINDFISDDFGNDIDFSFYNTYLGSNLKFQKENIIFNVGLFYHNYLRSTNQFELRNTLDKKYLLPELSIKYDIKRNEKLNFKYNMKVRFPPITKLILNKTFTNFNSVFRGDPNLENDLYHEMRLYYYKFSYSQGLNYNITTSYRKTIDGVRNNNIIEGINFITQPILIRNSDENFSLSGNFSKKVSFLKASLNGSYNFSKYLQFLNNSLQTNFSNNYSFGTGIKTDFLKLPNIDVFYKKDFNNYDSQLTISRFQNENFTIDVTYDFLKDFTFNADFNYQKFSNKNLNSSNENSFFDASLIYQKENSLWSFELSATNILNNRFRQESFFSDFLVSESRTFVQPRIILLKVSYKFD